MESPKSCLFGTVFILSILQFLAISWQFSQKNRDKKKYFFQNFFFKFLEIAFFEHNLARFEEKKISEISKKNFENFSFLEIGDFKRGFEFLTKFVHTN